MKNILIISFSNLKTDSRVRRHVNILKKKYTLTVACFDASPTPEYALSLLQKPTLTLTRKALIGFFLAIRWFSKAQYLLHPYKPIKVNKGTFDVVIANDVETLPLAFQTAALHKCRVILDAHEYAPRHFEDKLIWRVFFQPLNVYLSKKYIYKTAAMLTIGKGLATEYEKHFHVKPIVITNANHYHELSPSPGLTPAIRLVHHGIATPSRKLELMIEMMNHLDDRFTLDMYLLSSGFVSSKTKNYPAELKALAAKNPRVRILDPIKSEDIVYKINEYDIGVFLIPPINFNYANTLPNKLFDFIQARLAIAVGPTPEMAEIVNEYKIGVVSDDFSSIKMAEKLNSITESQLQVFKKNTTLAAQKLCAEENEKKLFEAIDFVLDHA